NALAESFVDSFKTELIKDRVWRTRSQLELAILEYVDWFNNRRLHESLGDIPPVEFEANWATATTPISASPSVTVTSPSASERLTTPRPCLDQTEIGVPARDQVEIDVEGPAQNGVEEEPGPLGPRQASQSTRAPGWSL
ncbi:MAG: IS3 family transposase, partial [Acidobacteriota bacterium]|nr:IS3 family transposase [Acidobacteriota bacterium]